MNEVAIGRSVYGKQGGFGGGYAWFGIEANKDNVYRVLPAIKTAAPTGQYAKYYRTHRGFRGSDNRQKPFRCIEEIEYKTKAVKVHCPVCDVVAEMEAQLKVWSTQGATKEQLDKFRMENIFPFQAEGKYYLNVVNLEGKIGILPIGSKSFKALDMLAKAQEAAGRDITGMEGIYLNFKKQSAYKGDAQAVFSVEIFMQPQPDGSYRPMSHGITEEFAKRLGPEAADLLQLFKVLDAEQIARIVSLQGAARTQYMDQLFEKTEGGAAGAATQQTYAAAPPAPVAPPQSPLASAAALPGAGFSQPPVQAVPPVQSAPAPLAPPPASAPPVMFTQPPPMAPPAGLSQAPAGVTQPPAGFTPPVGFSGTQGSQPSQIPGGAQPPAGFSGGGGGFQSGFTPPGGGAPQSQLNDQDFLDMVKPKR